MTLRIYGPDETWPTEGRSPHFRKPMEEAQAAGWSLHYHGAAHLFGILVCPAEKNDPHVHTFKVDKTAKGSGFWAAEASKTVTKKCVHGRVVSGAKVKNRTVECERLLEVGEGLIEQVAEGLDRAETYDATLEALDRLDIQLETASRTVNEVLLDAEASEAPEVSGAEAEAAALEALYTAEGAPTVDELERTLDDAAETVEEAGSVATRLSRGRAALAKPYLERAGIARARIEKLKGRLDGLTSDREAVD